MGVIHLNKKEHYVAITVVLIVLFILIMVTFSRANEGLDKFEKQELENGTEQYLSKGAS
ncbi:hypothetical protein QP836_00720 [Staphylococcus lugdunensis]|jgi:hypothetical protein|uniref:Uncharacterized protein n=1 Tax=Staphylococcus lugdunensis TaxID=28035 RepID=A0ABD4EFZ6_STALU|nr:hypothetical protein HMPREF0790_1610 [Staphylococcus lugdunensis M23590]KXA38430.1 hypothetical protein HMPREF3225_01232 [Staphylococcus lugdunensis]MDK8714753.1 hypothetical protein [Staphylococcus lugdunensis]